MSVLMTHDQAPMTIAYGTNAYHRFMDHTGTQVRIGAMGPQAANVVGLTDQTDLFGQGPAQGSLFGSGQDRLQAPRQRLTPDPDTIRIRLKSLLEKARTAKKMPWSTSIPSFWLCIRALCASTCARVGTSPGMSSAAA